MPESTFVIERHLFRVGVGRSDSSDVRDSSPAAYAPPMPSQRSPAQLTPSAGVTQTAPPPPPRRPPPRPRSRPDRGQAWASRNRRLVRDPDRIQPRHPCPPEDGAARPVVGPARFAPPFGETPL